MNQTQYNAQEALVLSAHKLSIVVDVLTDVMDGMDLHDAGELMRKVEVLDEYVQEFDALARKVANEPAPVFGVTSILVNS